MTMSHKRRQKWTWGAFLASIAAASAITIGATVGGKPDTTPDPTPTVTAAPSTPTPTWAGTPFIPPAKEPTVEPTPQATEAGFEVDRVVDGDAVRIWVNGESKAVRIIGIDTPETVHPRLPVECYGPEASAEAKRLLEGTRITIEQDYSQAEQDRYGRILGYVTMENGLDFGQHMIKHGYAKEATYSGSYANQVIYWELEAEASGADRGLWSACS